jgi:hypothetical protein
MFVSVLSALYLILCCPPTSFCFFFLYTRYLNLFPCHNEGFSFYCSIKSHKRGFNELLLINNLTLLPKFFLTLSILP